MINLMIGRLDNEKVVKKWLLELEKIIDEVMGNEAECQKS